MKTTCIRGILAGGISACLFLMPRAAEAIEIYYTDFDTFPVGPDQWVGTDGWIGNSTGLGVHGIDYEMIPGLDNTGFLGGSPPATTFTTLYRPVNLDPVADEMPIVEFESLMGIEDSTNNHRDSFLFTFYNITGNPLASIQFCNQDSAYGVWRYDGTQLFDTFVDFIRGELHLLYARIDFGQNLWSASLDGIPLFTEVPFNADGQPLTYGGTAAEWQLSSLTTNGWGNNWLLVADWGIRQFPREDPFRIEQIDFDSEVNQVRLQWTGMPGFDYQVEYAEECVAAEWKNDLPASSFPGNLTTAPLTFFDDLDTCKIMRVYRLKRTLSP